MTDRVINMSFFRLYASVVGFIFSMAVFAGEEPESDPLPVPVPVIKPKPVVIEAAPRDVFKEEPPVAPPVIEETPVDLTPPDYYQRETKIYPRNRIEEIADILKKIPTHAIAPFLTSPKVVEKETFKKSPYIIDFPDEHIIAGAGTRIYVRSILQPQTLNYSVYRKGQAYRNPETKELLGYEAVYLASATLQKAGDPAILLLTKSKQEVRMGDRLMTTLKQDKRQNFFPKMPDVPINANLISVLDGVSQIGRYNVVVIDKGLVDGLYVGDILDIYQKGRKIIDKFSQKEKNETFKLPDELAGTLMVFRSFQRVSYGLIMKATKVIHVFDKARTPKHTKHQ
jgi:hypothetical protein